MRVWNMRTTMGALGLLLTALLLPSGASAGVATAGAVLLDPFDPVPEIQFHHFGGYGCEAGCGGYDRCDDGCGRRAPCGDGCGGTRHRQRERCDDGCEVADRHHHDRDRCDRDCGDDDYDRNGDDDHGDHHDGDHAGYGPPSPPPCASPRCFDSVHWERHWRQGDHVGQQWFDSGYRERDLQNGSGPPQWYGHHPEEGNEFTDDDPPPPPPPPAPPPDKK